MKCAKFSCGSDGDQWSSIPATGGATGWKMWIFEILDILQNITHRLVARWCQHWPSEGNGGVESVFEVFAQLFHNGNDLARCIFYVQEKTKIFGFFQILLHFAWFWTGPELCAKMLKNAQGWNQHSKWTRNAAIHPNSMRLKYDEAVTLFFQCIKKLWDLATGGAADWSTCTFSALKFGKLIFFARFWGFCTKFSICLHVKLLQARGMSHWTLNLLHTSISSHLDG